MSQQNKPLNTISTKKDSFVPMLQAVYQSPIELHQTPDWSDKPYSVHRDPLWKTIKKAKALMMYGSTIVTIGYTTGNDRPPGA